MAGFRVVECDAGRLTTGSPSAQKARRPALDVVGKPCLEGDSARGLVVDEAPPLRTQIDPVDAPMQRDLPPSSGSVRAYLDLGCLPAPARRLALALPVEVSGRSRPPAQPQPTASQLSASASAKTAATDIGRQPVPPRRRFRPGWGGRHGNAQRTCTGTRHSRAFHFLGDFVEAR